MVPSQLNSGRRYLPVPRCRSATSAQGQHVPQARRRTGDGGAGLVHDRVRPPHHVQISSRSPAQCGRHGVFRNDTADILIPPPLSAPAQPQPHPSLNVSPAVQRSSPRHHATICPHSSPRLSDAASKLPTWSRTCRAIHLLTLTSAGSGQEPVWRGVAAPRSSITASEIASRSSIRPRSPTPMLPSSASSTCWRTSSPARRAPGAGGRRSAGPGSCSCSTTVSILIACLSAGRSRCPELSTVLTAGVAARRSDVGGGLPWRVPSLTPSARPPALGGHSCPVQRRLAPEALLQF